MSFYLVTGHGASTTPTDATPHLPTARSRTYPSDTSDAEWAVTAGLVPAGGTDPGRGGRPVKHPRRDIVDAIRYLAHNGCVWRALPVDFPHYKPVYHYFVRWAADGTLSHIHNTPREQARAITQRNTVPTGALIDSQSVRAAETVARTSRGYDAGKKTNGRKRHIVVDTTGPLLAILVTGAHIQDRDAGRILLAALRACFPTVSMVWADQGHTGHLVTWTRRHLTISLHIVRKLTGQTTFVVLHRRWVVERTFSRINRCRRTVRDHERLPHHHAAMIHWAMIIIMTRRLARTPSTT
jgi:transposase